MGKKVTNKPTTSTQDPELIGQVVPDQQSGQAAQSKQVKQTKQAKQAKQLKSDGGATFHVYGDLIFNKAESNSNQIFIYCDSTNSLPMRQIAEMMKQRVEGGTGGKVPAADEEDVDGEGDVNGEGDEAAGGKYTVASDPELSQALQVLGGYVHVDANLVNLVKRFRQVTNSDMFVELIGRLYLLHFDGSYDRERIFSTRKFLEPLVKLIPNPNRKGLSYDNLHKAVHTKVLHVINQHDKHVLQQAQLKRKNKLNKMEEKGNKAEPEDCQPVPEAD